MRLAEVLRSWRKMKDLSIRDVAHSVGVSAATLSRIERGENMDGVTLAKIFKWLTEAA
jgi:transcriptional regulator with XRE-family HTH domain